jgi:DNA repair protein RecN (Recombination protein N)
MLEELTIRNYALIESITLTFRRGFNVLTGETGAGKSIIVGSLSLLMGGKAAPDVIRSGADEAAVSAVVSIDPHNREALTWLESRDIPLDEDTVIVRRSIKTNGRSSIYIQHTPLTRNDLAEFMSLLFALHGQHSHESLLHTETHRRCLDQFSGITADAAAYNRAFTTLAEKRKTLEAALAGERDRDSRIELLQYAIDEIACAAPRPGETSELETESQRLSSFEKLAGHINTASACLFDDEPSLLSLGRRTRNALDSAGGIDNSLNDIQQRLAGLYYEAEDIASSLRTYRDRLTFDPQRLAQVDERLALLYRLNRKYGRPRSQTEGAEAAILAYAAEAQSELDALSSADQTRASLREEITAIEKDLASRASSLRQKRAAAAGPFAERITGILARLGMPNARFQASLIPKTREGGTGSSPLLLGPWGAEDIEFRISANSGEPLKDLARIASGGELSRVMLAIKTVLAAGSTSGADSIETLVFDEIDTGIGGEVALAVGEYLAKIGSSCQIFCVTHLASIAVRASSHFKVEKRTEAGRTLTGIGPLSPEGRRTEIARMLSGDSGHAALAHADDMIARYGLVHSPD